MSSTAGVHKHELENTQDIQDELHTTVDDEKITSIFYHQFRKALWYTLIREKLKLTVTEEMFYFTVNKTFNYLLYNYMRQTWPAIRVKDRYRSRVQIAWPHNLGTARIIKGDFVVGSDSIGNIDKISCDIHGQFYGDPGFMQHDDISIGNVKFIEEWTNDLPQYTTNVNLPMFYSWDSGNAFPLWYLSSQTNVHLAMKMKDKVSDLLRMRVRNRDREGNWYWKNLSQVNFKFIEGVKSDSSLPKPEIWGRYSYNTDSELDWYKCQGDRNYYYKDFIGFSEENTTKYGSSSVVSIQSDTPCLAMFWVAENTDATAIRNLSNYSTNTDDLYKGWDPLKNYTFKYSKKTRIDCLPSDHASIAEPKNHFPRPPSEVGYHAESFCNDSTSCDAEVGIVFTGDLSATLKCDVRNNDIFQIPLNSGNVDDKDDLDDEDDIDDIDNLDISEDKKPSSIESYTKDQGGPEFKTHVRLLNMKKSLFKQNGNSDNYDLELIF